MKLGVVLSGGGAKGAYEAGFLKALGEFNIVPDAVAGTSIGALNGAIYSANLNQGASFSANLVENIWLKMAQNEALKFDDEDMTLNMVEVISYFTPLAPITLLGRLLTSTIGTRNRGIYSNKPAHDILKQNAPIYKLKRAIPFYVGLTKSKGALLDNLKFFRLKDGESEYFKIQDLKDEDIYNAILASAALPLFFKAVNVKGEKYRDGCLGSQASEFGNTPVIPLIEDEKCTHLIICHLSEGSFFNRYDEALKNVNIIEIRPKNGTFNSIFDTLKFDINKIKPWIDQGYEDSKRVLSECFEALTLRENRINSEKECDEAINRLKNRSFKLFD